MYCVTSGCLVLLAFCTYSVTARAVPRELRLKRSYVSKDSDESPLMFEGPIAFPVGNSKGYKLICSANPNIVNPSDVQSISWFVKPDDGPEVEIKESSTGRVTIDVTKNDKEYENTLIITNLEYETYRCEIVTRREYRYLTNWFTFKFSDCFFRSRGLLVNSTHSSAIDQSPPTPPVRLSLSKHPIFIDIIQPRRGLYPIKLICNVDPDMVDRSDIVRLSWFVGKDDDSLVEVTESTSGKIKLDAATNREYEKTLIVDELPRGESRIKCTLETAMGFIHSMRYTLSY